MERVNILIIDDDEVMRETIGGFVTQGTGDCKVFQAQNCSEGYAKILKMKFEIMVADINTPKMNGIELVRECLKVQGATTPDHFVLISGSDLPKDTRIGKVNFFKKPLDSKSFIEKIKNLLNPATEESTGSSAPKIDVAFIGPFIENALKVLQVTTGTIAKKEKIFIRGAEASSGDISAIVAMNSEKYLGSMAICFEESCFLSVVNNMLGESYTKIDGENQDAAAEICNQIFGGAKTILNQNGHTIQPAIPSVIVGKNHRIKHLTNGVCLAVLFSTPGGKFTGEAVVQERVSP